MNSASYALLGIQKKDRAAVEICGNRCDLKEAYTFIQHLATYPAFSSYASTPFERYADDIVCPEHRLRVMQKENPKLFVRWYLLRATNT